MYLYIYILQFNQSANHTCNLKWYMWKIMVIKSLRYNLQIWSELKYMFLYLIQSNVTDIVTLEDKGGLY